MRRIMIISGTALAFVAIAASAYAVGLSPTNTYTATATFSPTKAGSKSRPVPVGIFLNYVATPTVAGDRAAALTGIRNTFYGIVSNGKNFPKCTVAMINGNHNLDTICPRGSEIGKGHLTSKVGAPRSNGVPCLKDIHVFNAGQGQLAFTLDGPGSECLGIGTGALGAFGGTLRVSNKVLTLDAPIPHFISFPLPGIVGSLITEYINYGKATRRGHGYFEAVGCANRKRPYSTSFTANNQTLKVTHIAACS